jgi:hypothetical protein
MIVYLNKYFFKDRKHTQWEDPRLQKFAGPVSSFVLVSILNTNICIYLLMVQINFHNTYYSF